MMGEVLPLHAPAAKCCHTCNVFKDRDKFGPNKRKKDGKSIYCRECQARANHEYYEAHKEEMEPVYAEYRETHRNYQNAYNATYRVESKDKITAHLVETHEERLAKRRAKREENPGEGHRYYETHKEESKKRAAKAYAEDPEKFLKRNAVWRKANPEQAKELARRRHARKKNAPVINLSTEQWLEILAAFNYRCAYCPKDCLECKKKTHDLTADHVTPYAHNGSHTLWNVVPACKSCNSRKHTGPPPVPVQILLLTVSSPKPLKRKKKDAS